MFAVASCLPALRAAVCACTLAALPFLVATAAPAAGDTSSAAQADQVSCLIPGEIKRLDNHTSYMSARRVIRTTRADCHDRGGEVNGQRPGGKAKGTKRGVEPEAIKNDPPPGAGYR